MYFCKQLLGRTNAVVIINIGKVFSIANQIFYPALSCLHITTGTRDLLFSQAMSLREQDVVVDLHVWDDLWHVFEWGEQLPEALGVRGSDG